MALLRCDGKHDQSFVLTEADLAQLLAAHTSGILCAIPDRDDFRMARKLLTQIETDLQGNHPSAESSVRPRQPSRNTFR